MAASLRAALNEVFVTALTEPWTSVADVTPGDGELRRVGLDDLDKLEVLDTAVFGDVAYPRFVLRQFYDLFSAHCYVIELDGDFCGYVLVGITTDGDTAWLLGLAVDSRYRSRGFGRRLLGQALECCRDARVKEVKITVRPKNPAAVKLYKEAGFQEYGSEPDYFGLQEERDVLYRSMPGNDDLDGRALKPETTA